MAQRATVAAAVVGQLTEFHPEVESVEAYLERASLYFDANNVAEDKQVSVLLTAIGPKVYSLLRNLCALTKSRTKTLVQLTTMLMNHYSPKPLLIAQQYHFNRRNQQEGESIVDYLAELRRLAATCNFGDQLNTSLRNRLVCGLNNAGAQRRLFTEADLTLEKALAIAQGMETAEANSKSLKRRGHRNS